MNTLPSQFLLPHKHSQILSYSALKLAVLTGQLSLLSFVMNVGYILFDLYHNLYHSRLLLTITSVLSLVSFGLNRQGYHFPAKLILGLTANLTIFVFASIEPVETSLAFLFVICAVGAVSTLGFEEKNLALIFVLLPVLLFFFSVVVDPALPADHQPLTMCR